MKLTEQPFLATIVELLLPVSKQADIDRLPRERRHVKVCTVCYHKQYENGINRAVGFDIVWV